MDRDLAQALGRMIPNDASVLEVGCGAGRSAGQPAQPGAGGGGHAARGGGRGPPAAPRLQFAVAEAPALTASCPDRFDAIICDRLVHSVLDVRALLRGLGERLTPDGRIFLTAFNYLWEVPTRLAEGLGWKVPAPTSNWLSASDFQNLFDMAGLEVVRFDDRLMLPLPIPGLDMALNRYLVKLPVLNLGSLYRIYVLRKRRGPARARAGRGGGPGQAADGDRGGAGPQRGGQRRAGGHPHAGDGRRDGADLRRGRTPATAPGSASRR